MLRHFVWVEVQPNTSPFGFASIKNSTQPKTVAILKADGELFSETARTKTVPVIYLYGMADG